MPISEVDGGHGPNTKMDIQMGSGQCKNIHVLYEHTNQSRSHTELRCKYQKKKRRSMEKRREI